jgi:hypothetical protein
VWNRIANGVPETSGTIISIILANLKVAGVSSMLSTIVEHFALLIQVFHGKFLMV